MDKKSILIGALVGAHGAILLFVTIEAGTSQDDSEAGTYEVYFKDRSTYKFNTKTGELYVRRGGWEKL